MNDLFVTVQFAADKMQQASDMAKRLAEGKRFYIKEYTDGSFEICL